MKKSIYQFGVGTIKPNSFDAARMARIARLHGAEFVQKELLCGYRHWFEVKDQGTPVERDREYAVLSALRAAGL